MMRKNQWLAVVSVFAIVLVVMGLVIVSDVRSLALLGYNNPPQAALDAGATAIQGHDAASEAYPAITAYPFFEVTTPDEVALRVYTRDEALADDTCNLERLAAAGNKDEKPDFSNFTVVTDPSQVVLDTAIDCDPMANLLFVHGEMGGAWTWEALFSTVNPAFNVYALSLRGQFTSGEVATPSLEDYVSDIRAVIGTIQGQNDLPIYIVAHGWGAPVAIRAILQEPGSIEKLALISPIVPQSYSVIQSAIVPNLLYPSIRDALESGQADYSGLFVAQSQADYYQGRYAGQSSPPLLTTEILDMAFLPDKQAALTADYEALAALEMPVVIAAAEYDSLIDNTLLNVWAGKLNAPVETFTSGHCLPLDAAYPQLAAWLDTLMPDTN